MVVIECPHCDKKVSNLAAKCPHCGKPITHSKLPAGAEYKAPSSGLAKIKSLAWMILILALLAAGVYYGLPMLGIKLPF